MKKVKAINILFFCAVFFILLVLSLMIYLSVHDTEYIRDNDPYDYAKVGESIWNGDGITLYGKPYVLLPPGFPVIAGGLNTLFQNPELSVKISSITFWMLSIFLFYHLLGYFFVDQTYRIIGVFLYVSNYIMISSAAAGRVEPVFLSFLLLYLNILLRKSVNPDNCKISLLLIMILVMIASVLYYLRPEGLWIAGVLWMIFILGINEPILKKVIYSLLFSIGIIVLIFPYISFLKVHTGQWQISGKTYANLVMGELDSPYQSGMYDKNAIPYRYTIIERIINNPAEARTFTDYLSESSEQLIKRIIPNLKSLTYSVWLTLSILGIILAVLGIKNFSFKQQIWIWGTLSVFCVYLLFFVLNRMIATYQPFLVVMIISGMIAGTEWLKKTHFSKWAETVKYVIAVLLMVYQMRNFHFS